MSEIDMKQVRALVALEIRKEELSRGLKEVNAEIESLWGPILEEMAMGGVLSIPLEEGPRLSKRRDIFCSKASGVPTQLVAQALKAEGLDWMVGESYDSGKLKEHIKALDEAAIEAKDMPDDIAELLPEDLRHLFRVSERTRIVVSGAKALAGTKRRDPFFQETEEDGGS